MENLQEKYDALIKRYNTLLDENEELKSILLQHGIIYPARILRTGRHSLPSHFLPSSSLLTKKLPCFAVSSKVVKMSLHEDGLARPLKKVAINRSVSTNGTKVPVTKTKQVHRMPEPKLCSFDKPKHLSPFGGKR